MTIKAVGKTKTNEKTGVEKVNHPPEDKTKPMLVPLASHHPPPSIVDKKPQTTPNSSNIA